MRIFIIILIYVFPMILSASDLQEIVKKVQQCEIVDSINYNVKAQESVRDAIYSTYIPTLKANYMYQYISQAQRGFFDPEHAGSVEASALIFDGFRRSGSINAQESRIASTKETLIFKKEQLSLSAINIYFNMKTIKATLDAKMQKEKQFANELIRLERFFSVGTITEDKVEQVRAALAMTRYEIEFLKQNYQELALSLETLSSQKITNLGKGSMIEKDVEDKKYSHELKAITHNIEALSYDSKVKTSTYWPTLVVKDTFSTSRYYDAGVSGLSIPASTNKVQLLASITITDFFTKSKESQAIEMQKLSKKSELEYKKRENDLNKKFASLKLKTVKLKIASSELSLKASKKSFEFIAKQHEVNLVDTSVYLGSASQFYNSKAILQASKYEYQMALANYYFYNNTPLLEMIK